jgi:hypothetical protein
MVVFVNEWHKSMISEKLSKTVDFRDEIPEPTWTCLRRVFESFSETMDSPD